jgi:hypothetical protein
LLRNDGCRTALTLNTVLDVLLELRLVALLVVVGKSLHVLSDVTAEDVLPQSVGIELLRLDVEAGETALRVGDEQTTVRSTLHGTEDTGTSGGTVQTDIKVGLEGAALLTVDLDGLGQLELSIDLLNTGEVLIELQLGKRATSQKETSGVGSGPVGETVLDAVAGKLVGVGGSEDLVTDNLGGDNLADDLYSRR